LNTSLGLPLRRSLSRIATVLTDRKVLVLLGILALGAYLRLWNIHHLFNAIHDYDEGIYALAARFISQGYLPYQDFTLAHPPLHTLTLASIYKVLGYDFFYSKYLSVALSLASIVVIYLAGKKMYHPAAGLAVAGLFAASPEMVYFGRRCVQESMGIFLVLVAVYLAVDFVNSGRASRLLPCGLCLGLAIATKYIFIPAVAGVILATMLFGMRGRVWLSTRALGRLSFWVVYGSVAALFIALLLALRWALSFSVSIPFFDPMYPSAGNVAVVILVFVVPLLVSLVMLEKRLPTGEWWRELWGLRRSAALWRLVGGVAVGFFAVTGYFWVKMPHAYVYQTLLMQGNRPYIEFPSLAAVIRTFPASADFLKMAFLPILAAIPLTLVILNKRSFGRMDCFLSVAMIVSLLFCQGFYHLPRYYMSVFPFLLLGVAGLMPSVDLKLLSTRFRSLALGLKAGLLVPLTSFVLFLSLSVVLLTNYTGYDINWPWLASNEEYVYSETIDYLEKAPARKVWAVNPIFVAMSSELDSTLAFDSFALLWLEETPSEDIVQDRIAEGVDYVVLDSWVRYWAYPYDKQARELSTAVRRNARLVRVVAPTSLCSTEIYLLGAERQGVFNGNFDQWTRYGDMDLPLGWEATLVSAGGDHAIIDWGEVLGKSCLKLIVCEDGQKDVRRESTHAGISQKIPFSDDEVRVEILPEVNAAPSGRPELLSGVHFTDDSGHSVVVGFSDSVSGEEVFEHESGYRLLVLKEARMGEWSQQTIDLARYWDGVGWPRPQEVSMLVVSSAHYQNPGCYSLCIASVGVGGG